jgi:hypothetical protein
MIDRHLGPRPVWTALDLARRRALLLARAELTAAIDRNDSEPVVDAWRELVGRLARADLARLAGHDVPTAEPDWRPPR